MKPLAIIAGLMLLSFVLCCGLGGIVVWLSPESSKDVSSEVSEIDEETAAMVAEAEAAFEERKKESAAEELRLHVDGYDRYLKKHAEAGLVVSKVEFLHDVMYVSVNDQWASLEKSSRMELAKVIASAWEARYAPSEEESSRVKIIDRTGETIGGFDGLWGVWVDD